VFWFAVSPHSSVPGALNSTEITPLKQLAVHLR
jgi:hypothetical protein